MPRGRELSDRERRGLRAYRAKRDADRTPEPFGAERADRPGLFVVQQHAARRLHYDLRLEWRGVLLSWAVPKGPSLDPAEKRLAVQVEDHPVEYADFEGVIPEGNYGAGAVIVWDLGRWRPAEDPEEGLQQGKLLFDLEGYKLRGRFTLVRTGGKKKPDGRDWLLIKKHDAFATDARRSARRCVRALGPHAGRAPRRLAAPRALARAIEEFGRAAPRALRVRAVSDAGRAHRRAVLEPGVAVRGEVRRLPDDRRARGRGGRSCSRATAGPPRTASPRSRARSRRCRSSA